MKQKTIEAQFCVVGGGLAGTWQSAGEFFNAGQRLVKLLLEIECIALKLTILETFGNEKVRVFAWDVK